MSGMLAEAKPNSAILANGIRNLFAHGHLSPAPKDCTPKRVAAICNEVSRFLIHFMDSEFSAVVKRYCHENQLDYDSLARQDNSQEETQ